MTLHATDSSPNEWTMIKSTLVAIWDNSPILLFNCFIFSIACLPTVSLLAAGLTIPAILIATVTTWPAWTGLLALEYDAVCNVKIVWFTLFKSLWRYWGRSALFGLTISFSLIAGIITLPLLSLERVPIFVWLALFTDALVALALVALSLYAFPMFVIYDLGYREALRNSALLASRRPLHTMGLIGMGILFALAIEWRQALAFFLPAIWGMFIINNCRLLLAEEKDRTG